jgi:hypothetical protein
MLRGEVAGLRAREDRDVPILHAELYDDVTTRVRADSRPWRPIPAGAAASPYRVEGRDEDSAAFSVVHLASGELHGSTGASPTRSSWACSPLTGTRPSRRLQAPDRVPRP